MSRVAAARARAALFQPAALARAALFQPAAGSW
jgi:hypothetical protein